MADPRPLPADVAAYFTAQPAGRRARLLELHALLVATLPAAEVSLAYRMPTYTTAQGWVAIANQKAYVSLYTCSPAHLAAFKARHPAIRTGKGCINFRDTDPLPAADIAGVVRRAAGG